ncbi:maleylpyruvate isomerase N-terminal domain-containing protein [Actinokineospora sp. 24-640]
MSPALNQDDLLDVVEREGTRAASAAEGADLDRPVPGCPGLTVGETTRHLGSVYRMVVTWIRTGARPLTWTREPGDGESVENYLRDGLRALLGELASHDPGEPCATWHPHDQTYAFWRRRMAHESTVHRVDVESALGRDLTPIREEVALDGIDEVLRLWFTHRLSTLGVAGTRPATVAVRAAHRTWLATMDTTRTAAADAAETAPATAVITADPTEMYLWLWGRRAVYNPAITQSGDFDAVAQLWALLRLATR